MNIASGEIEDSARHSTAMMWKMGIVCSSFGAVDTVIMSMVPISARHFTDNVVLISVLLAMKRMGGMFVQPFVAWWSDWRVTNKSDVRSRPRHSCKFNGFSLSIVPPILR